MAAAAACPETALPAPAGPEYEEDDDVEEECRICRLPAEVDRPLRRPCACRGSIKFVHDDCQLRWLAARHHNQCEVCNGVISTCPLYAADAPARLSLSELIVSLPNKLLGLLVPLLFAVHVVCDSFIHLATVWTWRIAFARTFLQVFHLLSFRVRPSSVFASIALWVVFVHSLVPFAVAPFARWVARLGTRRQGFGGLDGLQFLALIAVKASLTVLRLGVTISFSSVYHNVYEPFYTFYLKKLLCLLVDTIFVALVVFVPIEVADRLSPEVFPLDITYFDRPGKGTSVWQGPQNYAVSLSAILHIRFLISNSIVYLECLVERVIGYWFVTSGKALGSSAAPKDQNGSSDEANDKRTFVVVRTMLRVVLAWLTAVIFNTAMIFCPISVWRALLFAIPQLPVAGELKSNDLFAIAVGFFIISTIVATSRDIFACMTVRGPWLVDLKRHLLVFLWMVITPYMMGLLVDLSLISPFIGPDDDFPVLDFFCTWSLGWQVKNLWMNMLLTALGLPYLLAKGLFPRLVCSAAVNSTVYRFAWLSSLGFYAICYLGKVLCIKLHDSIRDDHYIIGERLQDVADCN
ncbi:hypothetical protein ACQ4PT_017253 [Festuca glaucescens]